MEIFAMQGIYWAVAIVLVVLLLKLTGGAIKILVWLGAAAVCFGSITNVLAMEGPLSMAHVIALLPAIVAVVALLVLKKAKQLARGLILLALVGAAVLVFVL